MSWSFFVLFGFLSPHERHSQKWRAGNKVKKKSLNFCMNDDWWKRVTQLMLNRESWTTMYPCYFKQQQSSSSQYLTSWGSLHTKLYSDYSMTSWPSISLIPKVNKICSRDGFQTIHAWNTSIYFLTFKLVTYQLDWLLPSLTSIWKFWIYYTCAFKIPLETKLDWI